MKSITIVIVMGVLLVVSFSVFGQVADEVWNQIPLAEKAHLITTAYSGSRKLSIMCYASTESTIRRLEGPVAANADIEEALGGHFLNVTVQSYGNNYFWPKDFAFTQNNQQYNVNVNARSVGYLPMNDAFWGGEMKPSTLAYGVIKIPDGIDTNRSFTIWYDDVSATLGPIDFGESSPAANRRILVLSIAAGLIILFVLISGFLVHRVRKKRRQTDASIPMQPDPP